VPVVHQALSGYADGHRLLSASRPLPGEIRRRLATHTDVAFDSSTTRLIAVLPLPELEAVAFSGMWPAPESPRPGSVWGHTLLVDDIALASMQGLGGLLAALRRPGAGITAAYQQPVNIEDRPVDVLASDRAGIEALLLAHYGWPSERATVIVDDLSVAERAVLGVWEQQWPALRRSFSCRLRVRAIGGDVDLEVAANRGRSGEEARLTLTAPLADDQRRPPWLTPLTRDALAPGDVRWLLGRFGPGVPRGRADVPLLARLSELVTDADQLENAVAVIARAAPAPEALPEIKRALLGVPAALITEAPERRRVLAAVRNAALLPWKDLDLESRVALLWKTEPGAARDVLLAARDAPQVLLDGLLAASAQVPGVDAIEQVAPEDPRLAALLARRRPAMLLDETLWRSAHSWQPTLLRALAPTSATFPPAELARALVQRADLLGVVVDADIVPTRQIVTELGAALTAARLDADAFGAWREIFGERLPDVERDVVDFAAPWPAALFAVLGAHGLRVAARLPPPRRAELRAHIDRVDEPLRVAVQVRLLRAALEDRRDRDGVIDGFGPVHQALVEQRVSADLWRELEPGLAPGNDWDRAERLRRSLVTRIKRDHFTETEVAAALARGGPKAALIARQVGKKGRARRAVEAAYGLLRWGWPT